MPNDPMTLTEFLTARLDEDEVCVLRDFGKPDGPGSWSEWLADVIAAQRAIVARYAYLFEHGDSGDARWVLPLLAQPYAAHPDFDPEWRV